MKISVYPSSFESLYRRIQFLENRIMVAGQRRMHAEHDVHLLEEENAKLCEAIQHLRRVIDNIANAHERVSDVIYAYERDRFLNEKHEE